MASDVVALTLSILQAGYLSANVDNIALTIDDGGISGAYRNTKETTDWVRVYRSGPTHKDYVGHQKAYATREDSVTVNLVTTGGEGKTPAGVDIRAHHVRLQNEVERVLQASRYNPDASWDVLYVTTFAYVQEYPDAVSSNATVLYRRIWRTVET